MKLGSATNFNTLGTLGIEEEYFLVDSSGKPTNAPDSLSMASNAPGFLKNNIDHELFKFILECRIPTMSTLNDAHDALFEMRAKINSYVQDYGLKLAASGLHPLALWQELDHIESPRYVSQLDRIQYPQKRNTTAGLHIHFGVDDAEKAIWMVNQSRPYLPLLLALSSNSPYWNGFDTGLQSARAVIFESLPNTGMPTEFSSMSDYLHFERLMVEMNSVQDRGALWHDVRPHTKNGTVEIRIMDAQTQPERSGHLLEYVYYLLSDLSERYDDGESGVSPRFEILCENKWRALRYGYDSTFINWENSNQISIMDMIESECQRLGTYSLRNLYDLGSGSSYQRSQYDQGGFGTLCRGLIFQ
tara:strand:- start:6532 stop:7608 length:1077 start_codon:yes stop_codon:yes gene_type:complete